jgi:hypothetical protein
MMLAAALLATPAAASPLRDEATLQLRALFSVHVHPVTCPSGTPTTTDCYLNVGRGAVPGLGDVSETYTVLVDQSTTCIHSSFSQIVLAVAGKGEIDAALTDPYGCDPPPTSTLKFPFTLTAGSGSYGGASGSGTITTSPFQETSPGTGTDTDTWSGSLAVAGVAFDLTAPTIDAPTTITVRSKGRGARVHYAVTATDDADGPVAVSCRPRSGALFPVGRTRVSCTATDSSANTATAHITVVVRRTRG